MSFFDFFRKKKPARKPAFTGKKTFSPAAYPSFEKRRSRGAEAGIAERSPADADAFLDGAYATVVSSMIHGAQYYAEQSMMHVDFKDGGFDEVSSISPAEAKAFITAPSHGVWYWDHVLVRGKGNQGKTKKPVKHG